MTRSASAGGRFARGRDGRPRSAGRGLAGALLGLVAIGFGCGARPFVAPGESSPCAPTPSAAAAAPDPAIEPVAPVEVLRFGLGRVVDAAEIAAWDLDVGPDGEGLPEGSGSVEAGRVLYARACRSCHGDEGTEGPFDRLVGRLEGDAFPFAEDPRAPRTIGSWWPFATTLFDYTRRAMPLDRPGSLTNAEVYALTAYLLHRNGLLDATDVLDRERLMQIEMPARSHFVRDDRPGAEVWGEVAPWVSDVGEGGAR